MPVAGWMGSLATQRICSYSITTKGRPMLIRHQQFGGERNQGTAAKGQSAEVRRLKAELKHVTEERDILKKAAYFAKG